jgi:hypothetical protein
VTFFETASEVDLIAQNERDRTEWLNAIGVAQFATRHFATAAGVPLGTWVFHQDRDNGIVTFEEPMRQAIEFFSAFIGPYPYEKLGGVQVTGLGGGMELTRRSRATVAMRAG